MVCLTYLILFHSHSIWTEVGINERKRVFFFFINSFINSHLWWKLTTILSTDNDPIHYGWTKDLIQYVWFDDPVHSSWRDHRIYFVWSKSLHLNYWSKPLYFNFKLMIRPSVSLLYALMYWAHSSTPPPPPT